MIRVDMVGPSCSAAILQAANSSELAESGGGHNQKGVDFQRFWAIQRMFELESEGVPDFLLLFEALQDVGELDSATSPDFVRIYQVKKKERREWSWTDITGLPTIRPKKAPAAVLDTQKIAKSPVGKLHRTLLELGDPTAEALFVSNAGCDIPLAAGGNAATSLPCDLSVLAPEHVSLLNEALLAIQLPHQPAPDLTRLRLVKVALSPDASDVQVVGIAVSFLGTRSPRHMGQAKAFVDALFIKIAPLGRRTDSCPTFEDLKSERGFSREQFLGALADLEHLPDVLAYLNSWLDQLQTEGMDFMLITQVRVAASRIFRNQLRGTTGGAEAIQQKCDEWIASNSPGSLLRPYFEAGSEALTTAFPHVRVPELIAHFALRAINQCADQT